MATRFARPTSRQLIGPKPISWQWVDSRIVGWRSQPISLSWLRQPTHNPSEKACGHRSVERCWRDVLLTFCFNNSCTCIMARLNFCVFFVDFDFLVRLVSEMLVAFSPSDLRTSEPAPSLTLGMRTPTTTSPTSKRAGGGGSPLRRSPCIFLSLGL